MGGTHWCIASEACSLGRRKILRMHYTTTTNLRKNIYAVSNEVELLTFYKICILDKPS